MLDILRAPPTHTADANGVFISSKDTAWDAERIDAEIAAEVAKQEATGVKVDPTEVHDRHPVARYLGGYTRYQLDAPDFDLDGKPAVASDYLRPDVKPVRFIFRRISRRAFEEVLTGPNFQTKVGDFIVRSLVEIQDPSGGCNWKREQDGGYDGIRCAADEIVGAIWSSSRMLHQEVGCAAQFFSGPLREHEGKR